MDAWRLVKQKMAARKAGGKDQADRNTLIAELLSKLNGDSESEATNACAVLVMLSSRESPPLELLDMARVLSAAFHSDHQPPGQRGACLQLCFIVHAVGSSEDRRRRRWSQW